MIDDDGDPVGKYESKTQTPTNELVWGGVSGLIAGGWTAAKCIGAQVAEVARPYPDLHGMSADQMRAAINQAEMEGMRTIFSGKLDIENLSNHFDTTSKIRDFKEQLDQATNGLTQTSQLLVLGSFMATAVLVVAAMKHFSNKESPESIILPKTATKEGNVALNSSLLVPVLT
jgi:hypothetical protein